MKSRKVLFGLFTGLFALVSSVAMGQVEIGPDNIGGRVTSLIVDQSDATHNTLYAGAATGGLYIRSNSTDYVEPENVNIWRYIPCSIDGKQRVLPISDMIQLPDNSLLIATGEGCFEKGTKFKSMAAKGVGLLRYDRNANASAKFTRIESTNPETNEAWSNISRVAMATDNNNIYVYVAAKGGLFRFVIPASKVGDANAWKDAVPEAVIQNEEMLDVAVVKAYNMVYFSSARRLYRISSLDAPKTSVVNVTTTNGKIFSAASRIQLAVSEADPDYLYAMVTDSNDRFTGIYLTINQNTWTLLTTSTVTPFSGLSGKTCGAICVDAQNSRHVFVGGASLWEGQGYTDGSIYQWTMSARNEDMYGSSNYMSDVFFDSYYVHSGINDIVQVNVTNSDGVSEKKYYIATNAGVFEGNSDFNVFSNINKGLNNVQVNGVAVCTDGSLLVGADYAANLFIQSRMDHNMSGGSGDVRVKTWYDPTGSGTNHYANVYWQGNGGQVAASRYQQYAPQSRRNLFFSAQDGLYARSYADYTDFSNTQTWTIGESFLDNNNNAGPVVAQMYLWESSEMSGVSDIVYTVDTNDYIYRDGQKKRIGRVGTHKEDDESSIGAQFKAGDMMIVHNTATAAYPFEYVFPRDTMFNDTSVSVTVIRNVELSNATINGRSFSKDTTIIYVLNDTIYKDTIKFRSSVPAGQIVVLIDKCDTVRDSAIMSNGHTIKMDCPIQTRLFLLTHEEAATNGGSTKEKIVMSWNATDFTRVVEHGNKTISNGTQIDTIAETSVGWADIFIVKDRGGDRANITMPTFGVSRDADMLLAVVARGDSSFLFRIRGIMDPSKVDYHSSRANISDALKYGEPEYERGNFSSLVGDTIYCNGKMWFPRQISSIVMTDNDKAIITFQGHGSDAANVMVMNNASKASYSFKDIHIDGNMAAYSSMVEKTTGDVFIGTEDGLFKTKASELSKTAVAWESVGEYAGVPITTLVQQEANLDLIRNVRYEGFDSSVYVFPRTKYPYAIYVGTYGRGVFMDTTYVPNDRRENEVLDPIDYVGITPVVNGNGQNKITLFPNPAVTVASIEMNVVNAGNAALRIYDISGKLIENRNLGYMAEGSYTYQLDCSSLAKGMYLVNLNVGNESAASKLIVR